MNIKPKNTVVIKSTDDYKFMTRIPISDLEDGYSELSANAFKLLTYFYSKGDGFEFRNEAMAKALRLGSIRTVKSLIKELEKKGFLLIQKGRITDYFVGKRKVSEYK